MSVPHNENSRVKIPALVHFTRLNYEYVSLKDYPGEIDSSTNIFVDIFREAINHINQTGISTDDAYKIIKEISIKLSNDDLGKEFYSLLLSGYNGLKLIDFDSENGNLNKYQIVTELTYKNGYDEFRPDITVLINGMPLAFIEVKKPNNKDGVQAEYNRIITSMFSHRRIMMILKYAITYVERTDDSGITTLEKHLMRYPQMFATMAIEKKLNSGVRNGIIWHTQGSGKTALAYYNVRYLKDYYQKQGIIAKFYFVVDRLDLLTQAADEFRARGLNVKEINSRDDFVSDLKYVASSSNTGTDTITVLNIQKFSEDSVVREAEYMVNIQRIYFLDEAHRSYRPTGSFLSYLMSSDRDAVMIALTGTPLIGTIYDPNTGVPVGDKKYNSKDVFGDYIHKYYYNRSIADRYTLRLIREGIATTYRRKLQKTLNKIEVFKGALTKKELYAHPKYVKGLVEYIVDDFGKSRVAINDNSIGGMIVADSSEQAREIFTELKKSFYTCALILHDEDDTETRRNNRNAFNKGQIDFLIVYNMLLTGFDAPRLKKLYLGRVIKDHSLLQALTRVNRPYRQFRYGYVVDFADIRAEFDKTNKAYFDELQAELGDEFKQYDNIFKTPEEIEEELALIAEKLFLFDTANAEVFSQQISSLDDKGALIDLRQALETYKDLFNIAKLFGYDGLAEKFNLENIGALYNEVNNRISLINLKNTLQKAEDMSAVLNMALDEIDFQFTKVSENELVIADKFRETLEKTRREMQRNLDPKDPVYITLLEELQRLLNKKNIEELTADEMNVNIVELERIRKVAEQKNLADQMLTAKYENDPKFMRTHKRLRETPPPLASDLIMHKILLSLKHKIDSRVLANAQMLNNEPYFKRDLYPLIREELHENNVIYTAARIKEVGDCISQEYFDERNWAS